MAKSSELRVEIQPELLEQARRRARVDAVRLPFIVEQALAHYFARDALLDELRVEIRALRDVINAIGGQIEPIASFLARTAVSTPRPRKPVSYASADDRED